MEAVKTVVGPTVKYLDVKDKVISPVVYYKVTRPDGTDFFTGAVRYAWAMENKKIVRHLKPELDSASPAHYLSISTDVTRCCTPHWPLRLFQVAPVGPTRKDDYYLSKVRCEALYVIKEMPSYDVLGVHGLSVLAVAGLLNEHLKNRYINATGVRAPNGEDIKFLRKTYQDIKDYGMADTTDVDIIVSRIFQQIQKDRKAENTLSGSDYSVIFLSETYAYALLSREWITPELFNKVEDLFNKTFKIPSTDSQRVL